MFVDPCKGGFMKFKKLSDHFWKVEANGNILIGPYEQLEKQLMQVQNWKN